MMTALPKYYRFAVVQTVLVILVLSQIATGGRLLRQAMGPEVAICVVLCKPALVRVHSTVEILSVNADS